MKTTEPTPADRIFPRYTRIQFPAYRYVPGRSPHPRRDPLGHSFDKEEPEPVRLDPDAWTKSIPYLYSIDLYNYAYWWEAHEAFEALWQGADKEGPLGDVFRGMIQIAASNLKRFMGSEDAAKALATRGLARLSAAPSPWLGMDIREFEWDVLDFLSGVRSKAPLIKLKMPG